eukprot:g46097.t1
MRLREGLATIPATSCSPDSAAGDGRASENQQEAGRAGEEKQQDDDEDVVCRICWEGTTESAEPLVRPCACTGTQAFLHVSCLRTWQAAAPSVQAATSCVVCGAAFTPAPPEPSMEVLARRLLLSEHGGILAAAAGSALLAAVLAVPCAWISACILSPLDLVLHVNFLPLAFVCASFSLLSLFVLYLAMSHVLFRPWLLMMAERVLRWYRRLLPAVRRALLRVADLFTTLEEQRGREHREEAPRPQAAQQQQPAAAPADLQGRLLAAVRTAIRILTLLTLMMEEVVEHAERHLQVHLANVQQQPEEQEGDRGAAAAEPALPVHEHQD